MVTSLRVGSGRSDAIAIVVPSGDTTGSLMNPIHLSDPAGSTSPSSTFVGEPPSTDICMIEGTSIWYVRIAPFTLHRPVAWRVRTK